MMIEKGKSGGRRGEKVSRETADDGRRNRERDNGNNRGFQKWMKSESEGRNEEGEMRKAE